MVSGDVAWLSQRIRELPQPLDRTDHAGGQQSALHCLGQLQSTVDLINASQPTKQLSRCRVKYDSRRMAVATHDSLREAAALNMSLELCSGSKSLCVQCQHHHVERRRHPGLAHRSCQSSILAAGNWIGHVFRRFKSGQRRELQPGAKLLGATFRGSLRFSLMGMFAGMRLRHEKYLSDREQSNRSSRRLTVVVRQLERRCRPVDIETPLAAGGQAAFNSRLEHRRMRAVLNP